MSTRSADVRKEIRALIRELKKRGWTYYLRRRGHGCLEHEKHGTVFISTTPSDLNAVNQIRRQIERLERSA